MSLDLCPDFLESVVGQAAFHLAFHKKVSQFWLTEDLENQNLAEAGLISYLKKKKHEMDIVLGCLP